MYLLLLLPLAAIISIFLSGYCKERSRQNKLKRQHIEKCEQIIRHTPTTLYGWFEYGYAQGSLAILEYLDAPTDKICKVSIIDYLSNIDQVENESGDVREIGFWLGVIAIRNNYHKLFDNFAHHFDKKEWALLREKVEKI